MKKIPDILSFKEELLDFLKSINLSYGSNNRFEQSFKEVQKALDNERSGFRDSTKEAYLRHALSELEQLNFVITTIKKMSIDKNILRVKFRDVLCGERPIDKKSIEVNDKSRNTLFELQLMCFLHDRDVNIEYESGSDIKIEYHNKIWGIECKRINTKYIEIGLRRLLKDAYKQLLSQKDKIDYGIIAISIDNYVFDNGKLVISTDLISSKDGFFELTKKFINNFGKIWQQNNIVKNKDFVPAVFICLNGTNYSFAKNQTTNNFFFQINNTSYPPNPSFGLLKKFFESINNE